MKILVIRAYDHFSTDDKTESEVVVQFIGEYTGEDENYIFLRHCKADIHNPESAEELHKVLKCAIKDSEEYILKK
jgi:hypothetical protein